MAIGLGGILIGGLVAGAVALGAVLFSENSAQPQNKEN